MPDKLSGVQVPGAVASLVVSELKLRIELELPVTSMSPDKWSFSESDILKYEGRKFTLSDLLEFDNFGDSISSSRQFLIDLGNSSQMKRKMEAPPRYFIKVGSGGKSRRRFQGNDLASRQFRHSKFKVSI